MKQEPTVSTMNANCLAGIPFLQGGEEVNKGSQLTDLDLMGTSITPACIDDLARFKNLRVLRLSVKNWKKVDVQKLVSLLPGDCRLLVALPDDRREGFRGIDWKKGAELILYMYPA